MREAALVSEAVFWDVTSKNDVHVVICLFCALLACLTWEWVINISFEIDFLHKADCPFTKGVYCNARYLALCVAIADLVFAARVLVDGYLPSVLCSRWFAMQLVAGLLMLLNIEIMLFARVFALYERSPHMGGLFIAFTLAKTVAITLLAVRICKEVILDEKTCLVRSMPSSTAIISILGLFTEILIVVITFYKSFVTTRLNGGHEIPLLRLITRDGIIAFALVLVMHIVIIVDSKRADEACRVIFPVITASLSIATCRMTRNLRTFPVAHESNEDLYLTSVHSVDP